MVVMYWDRYITEKGPILGRKFLLEENDWLVTRPCYMYISQLRPLVCICFRSCPDIVGCHA